MQILEGGKVKKYGGKMPPNGATGWHPGQWTM